MRVDEQLMDVLERIRIDPRLGPPHVSLYMAIWHCWMMQGADGPVLFTARELMPGAKIAGGNLLYKSLRELHAYGYLVYEPSFNPAVKSRGYLNMLDERVVAGNGDRLL
jgi:hypothetical protein